jgi:hypothetical protein
MGNKIAQAAAAAIALLGSSVLPALIMISEGHEIQLGDVVQAAFERSGLTAEDWNAQDDAVRESLLNAEIEIIKATKEAEEKAESEKAAAEIAAAKEKAGSAEVVLLRDSNLGNVGDVVKLSKLDIDTYKAHGFVDDHQNAIKHAKAEKAKASKSK